MKYVFEDGKTLGTNSVKNFKVCWYDMNHNRRVCFDESFVDDINKERLMYARTENEEVGQDISRVFVNTIDGKRYEVVLKDVTGKDCSVYE